MKKKQTDISDQAFSMMQQTSGKVSLGVKDAIRKMNPASADMGHFDALKGGNTHTEKQATFKRSGITNKAALPRGTKNK